MAILESNAQKATVMDGEIHDNLIQFFFCLSGEGTFDFYGGNYQRTLGKGRSFLIFHPLQKLPFQLTLASGTKMVGVFIAVEKLHSLFLHDFEELSFLSSENINKQFYAERPIAPGLKMVLDQLSGSHSQPANQKLYCLGKTYELLSMYFDKGDDQTAENCPFLLDERNVEKIRKAKQIVIEKMLNPPGLKELSLMVGLNVYQLKVGFKNIYGSSVFQYLNDMKMEHARKLLDEKTHKVNEISDRIGYSNPSHFIAAFKRKYGITPKKYLQALT